MASLPVVDLAQGEQIASAELLHACEKHGFFYLTGHGIPAPVVENVFRQAASFFALSDDIKMKYSTLHSDINRGYTPMMEEALDPTRQSLGDTKEGFYIGTETLPDSSCYSNLPLHGVNQFPDNQTLPDWRTTMEAYHTAMTQLGHRMARLVALSLGLPPSFFAQYLQHPMAMLRLLHYSTTASDPDNGLFACGAHSDYGMLTLLAVQPGDRGLEILRRGSDRDDPAGWMAVGWMKDAFIVNVGDMLERWTNGRFASTLHRVVNRQAAERWSVPFFFDPDFTALVGGLPSCCSAENPQKYEPILAGEHLMEMYAKTHTDYKKPA